MKEVKGDIWKRSGDVRVITTNGYVKRNGEAVMGRGVALQAARRYQWLPKALGEKLLEEGNHVHLFNTPHGALVTYPVKYNWWQAADPELIERSAKELIVLTNEQGWQQVLMVRPGCGNGQLTWDVVKPILVPLLDDRFIIVER